MLVRYLSYVTLSLLLLINHSAFAATSTSNMGVTANVTAVCSVSASTLAFGAFTGAQLDTSTNYVVYCTNGAPYTVDFSAGAGTGATTTTRVMTNTNATSNTTTYAIYSDSGRSTVCGANCASGTGNGSGGNLYSVYGRMFVKSNPYVGPYSDTVVITVNY